MYQSTFGSIAQITFNNEQEYYELLGYLAKNNGFTHITWEDNDLQGAWGKEGRIEFMVNPPAALSAYLKHTAGNGGSVLSRVNCNEFIENIVTNHNFVKRAAQNMVNIRATVPVKYQPDFDRGYNL